MKNHIADGFTITGFIAELPGIHEPCRFKYRRVLHAERAKILDAGRIDKFNFAKASYLALEKHLVEWDVMETDAKGKEVGNVLPLTAVNVARLAPILIERMLSIVTGSDASDPDPTTAPAAELDQFDVMLESSTTNDARREAELKN